jgi:hypothetical protein
MRVRWQGFKISDKLPSPYDGRYDRRSVDNVTCILRVAVSVAAKVEAYPRVRSARSCRRIASSVSTPMNGRLRYRSL